MGAVQVPVIEHEELSLKMESGNITRLLLAEGNEVSLRTAGLSMGHAIRGGEAIVIRAVAEPEIRFGDIIVFDR